MSKVHLFKRNSVFDFTKAKTECGITVDNDNVETIDPTKVTCENCKKTERYKSMIKTHNEVMQIGVDLMKEKQEKSCAKCSNRIGEMDCKIATRLSYDDNGDCTDWRDINNHEPMLSPTFNTKPNDPAIELLNDFAEMLKLSELNKGEKLKVIDFLESRIRQDKL